MCNQQEVCSDSLSDASFEIRNKLCLKMIHDFLGIILEHPTQDLVEFETWFTKQLRKIAVRVDKEKN